VNSKKSWSTSHSVTQNETLAYARATNDDNARYTDGKVGPPMFGVFLEMPALMESVKDPEVIGDPKRFLRLLHGEHDMRFFGPIVPGARYKTSAHIAKQEQKSSGEVIELALITTDEATGATVIETTSTMFIRAEKPAEGKSEAKPAPAAATEPTPLFSVNETVAADQSLRYADASGDHNPIHKNPEVAAKAGLPGIILHGLCTMAFCQKAIINQLCGGDPSKLKRLKVRFAKPVLMGQTLTITAGQIDSNADKRTIGFTVRTAHDNAIVLKDGLAEIAA
jgi:acyl dehydratase